MSSIDVRLPTGIELNFDIYANAAWRQRVYLEGPLLNKIEHSGSGSNQLMGSGKFTLAGPVGGASPVTVTCLHDEGSGWVSSQARHTGPLEDSYAPPGMTRVRHVVESEDAGDGDWNDSITTFYWYYRRTDIISTVAEAVGNHCTQCTCSGFIADPNDPTNCIGARPPQGRCQHSYLYHPA